MNARIAAFAVVITGFGATAVNAQNTASHDVTYEVQAINKISLAGTPSLTISTAVAGSAPTAVTSGATYAITTNESNRKITAEIDSDMPTGLALTVEVEAPAGSGLSLGPVVLSSSAEAVVTGISKLNESGLDIEYGLSATSAAGVFDSDTRTVTYTVAAGA
jgi:hypothetical protein